LYPQVQSNIAWAQLNEALLINNIDFVEEKLGAIAYQSKEKQTKDTTTSTEATSPEVYPYLACTLRLLVSFPFHIDLFWLFVMIMN
jgi:hypothetical protein